MKWLKISAVTKKAEHYFKKMRLGSQRPLTPREKWIFALTVFLAALYLLLQLVIFPVTGKLVALKEETERKSILLQKYASLLKKAPEIVSSYKAVKDEVEVQHNIQEETTTFFKEIESAAVSSGLIVEGIKPMRPEEENNFTKVFLEINCEGAIGPIMKFICSLENTSLLISISSLQISPQRNNPQQLQLSLTAYKIIFN